MRQLKISTRITNRDSLSVEKYLQEIGKIPLVSPEDEVVLAQKIKRGDQKALDTLIKANLRFVVSVAKQYQNQGLRLLDLISEGNLGLTKAAQRFDETRGFKFISYAVWWIRQSIHQAIADYSGIVRTPSNKLGLRNKSNRFIQAFSQEHDREPSNEELAALMEISESHIDDLLKDNLHYLSLDQPIGQDDSSESRGDMLSGGDSSDHKVLRDSLEKEIALTLGKLTPRESEILILYYGLEGEQALNFEEIGKKCSVTKERARQIKERAIKRLQHRNYGHRLKHYLG